MSNLENSLEANEIKCNPIELVELSNIEAATKPIVNEFENTNIDKELFTNKPMKERELCTNKLCLGKKLCKCKSNNDECMTLVLNETSQKLSQLDI